MVQKTIRSLTYTFEELRECLGGGDLESNGAKAFGSFHGNIGFDINDIILGTASTHFFKDMDLTR